MESSPKSTTNEKNQIESKFKLNSVLQETSLVFGLPSFTIPEFFKTFERRRNLGNNDTGIIGLLLITISHPFKLEVKDEDSFTRRSTF